MKYEIGSKVEIRTIWNSYVIGYEGPTVYTVKGTVVKTPSWVEYPALAVKTGVPDNPLSIIPLDRIEGYEDEGEGESRAYTVGKYIVTVINDKPSCTCIGFQFRRYCKHVKEIDAR